MKFYLPILLLVSFSSCFSQTGDGDEQSCKVEHLFNKDFREIFETTDSISNLFEFVLIDKFNQEVLDGYGYIVSIKQEKACVYSFYLNFHMGENLVEALKYNLSLNRNSYTIKIDTTYNPYKGNVTNGANDLLQEYNVEKQSGMDIHLFDSISFVSFKGILAGEYGLIELFRKLKSDFPELINSDFLQLERILVDYGYIPHPRSKSGVTRIYTRRNLIE